MFCNPSQLSFKVFGLNSYKPYTQMIKKKLNGYKDIFLITLLLLLPCVAFRSWHDWTDILPKTAVPTATLLA